MFKKILIANRGEIAVRVMRTAKRLGVACVAVYSNADRDALHVEMADEAFDIGPAPAAQSYLNIDNILHATKRSGADAVHPGYGFLSENAAFVEAVEAAGLVFIGPPASAMRAMGLKDAAKRLMEKANVPVVPGYHGDKQDAAFLEHEAKRLGYPVLIKARAGGGGKGMRKVEQASDFKAALESAAREATSSFGDGRVLIESYVAKPRHIEIQVFADKFGNAVHLFERDCSAQRRHQKVIEEAPAPGMTGEMREAMGGAAVKAALAVGYQGAGTVEFIVDASQGLRADRFYFMEMNTRLQVEHPVTEAITGHDLVEWQLRVAAGEALPVVQGDLRIHGHAFEARIYAEDAGKGFLPATGRLDHLHLPHDLARVDAGVREGDRITPYYDPMIAKVIVHGSNRAAALAKLTHALRSTRVVGCVTNVAFLAALAQAPDFLSGDVDTGLIERAGAVLTAQPAPSRLAKALGALAGLGLLEPSRGSDPWTGLTGFHPWRPQTYESDLEVAGRHHNARVSVVSPGRFTVEADTQTTDLTVKHLGTNHWHIECESRACDAIVVAHRSGPSPKGRLGNITVFLNGAQADFSIPDALAKAGTEGPGGDAVTSPMPGLVKVVSVKAGQRVIKGEALAVVEAMKMEHTLKAPRDGVIAEVLAAVGDQVDDGAVLVRLKKSVT